VRDTPLSGHAAQGRSAPAEKAVSEILSIARMTTLSVARMTTLSVARMTGWPPWRERRLQPGRAPLQADSALPTPIR
jgi:hypothetical protein